MIEDSPEISKGELWFQFKNTDWGGDLYSFFDEQEKIAREVVCNLTIDGKYEEAKAAAHKINGILFVKNYIEDSIALMKEAIEEKQEAKEYRKLIHKHV